jgi:hypothetical protein
MPRKKKEPAKAPKYETQEPKYILKPWKGMQHYECTLCSFDTFSTSAIFDHIASHQLVSRKPVQPVEAQQNPEQAGEAFEVELEELSSFTDAEGNQHKQYTLNRRAT